MMDAAVDWEADPTKLVDLVRWYQEFKGELSQLDLSKDSINCALPIQVLYGTRSAELIAANLLAAAEASMEGLHLAQFWFKFCGMDSEMQGVNLKQVLPQALSTLSHATDRCCQNFRAIHDAMESSPECRDMLGSIAGLEEQFRLRVGALLRAKSAPHKIVFILSQYFKGCLEEFSSNAKCDSGDEMDVDEVTDAPRNALDIMGESWVEGVVKVSTCLRELGLGAVSDEACTGAVCENVSRMLSKYSGAKYWAEVLPVAKHYVACVPMEFLKLVLTNFEPELDEWQARLDCFLYESLGDLRIKVLFDMAVEFPASMPAVRDLCECLNRTTLQPRLLNEFRRVVSQRLLHGGASTSVIIKHFNLVVRMLSHIDPSGFLLDRVSEPYRQYLRGRQDTMKCIVTMLTDTQEEGPSMLEEFSEGCTGEMTMGEASEDDDMALRLATTWNPAPVQLDNPNMAAKSSVSDVISTLVGVYGSNDMFIEEYRKILGDRLLSKTDYECTREIRTLELLKIRFGETALHNCEVMLRDMSESKRLQQHLMGEGFVTSPTSLGRATDVPLKVSATIMSELFWPELPGKGIKLPEKIQALLDIYGKRYYKRKDPRILKWKTELGQVDLDVTVGKTMLSFSVAPPYAVILMSFQHATSRMANDLARDLGMTPAVLRSKALFWVNNGVLVETRGQNGEVCYRRADEIDKSRASAGNVAPSDMGFEEEGPSTMITGTQDTDYAEMKVFQSYILDLLRNQIDGRTLDQIQHHLRMFVIQPRYDKTQDQLASFLARLADLGEIKQQAGLYKVCQG